MFPFNHKIAGSNKDDQRRDLMMNELPGILNRFVAGLARLRKRARWDFPMDCIEAGDTFATHANVVGLFKHEFITRDPDSTIVTADVWKAFEAWIPQVLGRGHERSAPGRNGFYDAMTDLIGMPIPCGGNRESWRGNRMEYVDPMSAELEKDGENFDTEED